MTEVGMADVEVKEVESTLANRISSVVQAACSSSPVHGLTHDFYRYPARFSPEFARAAVLSFSNPGDTVIDPFMGGGTTVVEAITSGRRAVGCDVNSLSMFLARVKTNLLSQQQVDSLASWACDIAHEEMECRPTACPKSDVRFRNTPWWIHSKVQSILARINQLKDPSIRRAARCALLKTSQWALDCREFIPASKDFCQHFLEVAEDMATGYEELRERSRSQHTAVSMSSMRRVLHRSSIGLDEDGRVPKTWLPAKLVVTSPPYPGVHVLYHRWQVQGRRETPAAYGICDIHDGFGLPHYTMGGRAKSGVDKYFIHLKLIFSSMRRMLSDDAWVVQLIAFSDPSTQVARYLEAMNEAGFNEVSLNGDDASGRQWRIVPGRKWYIRDKDVPAGRELILLHRPA
jgi:hypothetical protein